MKEVNFARNLATLRKIKRFSQEEMSEKCDVSRQAVAKWESGTQPDFDMLTKICDIMDVTLEELIYGEIGDQTDDIKQVKKIIKDEFVGFKSLLMQLCNEKDIKPINHLYEEYLSKRADEIEFEAGIKKLEEGRKAIADLETDRAFELFEQAISRGVTSAAFELMKLFSDWYESSIEMESNSEIISLEVFCGKYLQIYGRILVEENMRKNGFDDSIYQ
ncbi:MAG: helix-turn-helix domain-containing protein [Mobilitalea sp.]